MAQPLVSSHVQARNWILWGGAAVTLFFWAPEEDPFNLPKSLLLAVSAAWVIGYLVTNLRGMWADKSRRPAIGLVGAYAATLLVAFIATDYWQGGFFGDYARRTGLLTYLCLAILMLGAIQAFSVGNGLAVLDQVALVVGGLLGIYGLMQHFNLDFVKWNNPYNSILSTLGNPDFASAAMAIFLVLAFGIAISPLRKIWMRSLAAFNVVVLLAAIVFSQARQGLLAGLIGVGIVILVWVYQRNVAAGHGLAASGFAVLVVGGIGMLDMGPLKSFMYKVSVTYRGDYWRAAWRMFTSHPIFGVGLDRYGAYFRQYRDATQAIRRGPNLVSNAAHDVPLQLAATGGIIVLIAFLALTFFIGWRGWIAIRRQSGWNQIRVAAVIGAWVTYQAQSLISIDNLGIAVWGWILGGIVIALSLIDVDLVSAGKSVAGSGNRGKSGRPGAAKSELSAASHGSFQPFVSGILATIAVAFCVPIFMQDLAMKTTQSLAKPTSNQISAWNALALKPLHYGWQELHNKVQIGLAMAQANEIASGEQQISDVIAADPRDFEALDMLASIYEQLNQQAKAIPVRQSILKLDPYNYISMLSLAGDYAGTGEKVAARNIYNQILTFASATPEGAKAKAALATL
jgi:O-antigen ligase